MSGILRNRVPSLLMLSLIAVVLAAAVPQPAAASEVTSSANSAIAMECDTPGIVIEAGETADFDMTITNNGYEINRQMWYETYDTASAGWTISFLDGTKQINILSLPSKGTKELTVEVETSSDTPVGKYPVRINIGDGYYWLYVTISKTHTGEKGTMEMTVVDNEGERIKGATVTVKDPDSRSTIASFMSTADGTVSAVVEPGTYLVSIEKNGYAGVEKKDVKLKGGITTDVGTVMLEKNLYAAEVTVASPILTTTASTNAKYDVTIDNIGKADDTYKLSVTGAPSGWYYRFRQSGGQSIDLSEIFIGSGDEKDLTLEAIPPSGVSTGTYNITLVVDSSESVYTENLTTVIRGDYDLTVYADQYQYDYYKGGNPLTFDLTLSNKGTARALTNVNVSATAPDGWNVDVSPGTIAGIQPGEDTAVSLRVIPPADIAASEYKISVAVTSDQTKASDDFRIDVHEQSFIGIIGIILIVVLCAGVVYMFRKYNRR